MLSKLPKLSWMQRRRTLSVMMADALAVGDLDAVEAAEAILDAEEEDAFSDDGADAFFDPPPEEDAGDAALMR